MLKLREKGMSVEKAEIFEILSLIGENK